MDRDFLIDLFAHFGPVTIKPMFSGFGISADGTNFALALRSGLYFRADDQTIARFETEGSKPFQYQTRAKTVTVNSYWELPARLFDDPEELSEWARAAWHAAQRAAVKKRPKPPKSDRPTSKKIAPKKAKTKVKTKTKTAGVRTAGAKKAGKAQAKTSTPKARKSGRAKRPR